MTSAETAHAQSVPHPYPPPQPPPVDPCKPCTAACNTSCEDKDKHDWGGVVGVRGSLLSVKGSDHDGLTTGATFTGTGDHHETKGHVTWHGSYIWGLGGGTGGIEGGLGLGLAGGLRANFGAEHGPFARVGAMGELWGNERFYFSRLELPMAEVGYQYLASSSTGPERLVEIGARAAPILGGRYDVGDNARRETSSSYEWGGYLALHSGWGRLDVGYNRIQLPTRTLDTPIDTVRGEACVFANVGPAPLLDRLGICLDVHYLHGDVVLPSGNSSAATTFYGGLTIGYATW